MSAFFTAYRETDLHYSRQPGQYPWLLDGVLDTRIPGMAFPRHTFLDRGTPRGEIWGSRLRIFPGYAINGASPSIVLGKFRLGTPTPKSSLPGVFVHDFLYQFLPLPCAPWTRDDADAALLALLDGEGFPIGGTYYGAVRAFGGLFAKKRGSTTGIACLMHH